MTQTLKERFKQAIDEAEFDVYDLLMDMIDLLPEDKLAQYIRMAGLDEYMEEEGV